MISTYFICKAFEYFVPSGFKLLRFMYNEVFAVKDMFIINKKVFWILKMSYEFGYVGFDFSKIGNFRIWNFPGLMV